MKNSKKTLKVDFSKILETFSDEDIQMMMDEAKNQPKLFQELAKPLVRKVGFNNIIETRELNVRFREEQYLYDPSVPYCEESITIFDSERNG